MMERWEKGGGGKEFYKIKAYRNRSKPPSVQVESTTQENFSPSANLSEKSREEEKKEEDRRELIKNCNLALLCLKNKKKFIIINNNNKTATTTATKSKERSNNNKNSNNAAKKITAKPTTKLTAFQLSPTLSP